MPMNIAEELQAIRKQLRLAMNGVVSTSLREKGMNYRLIFGTPIPELRQLARNCTPGADLAEALWKEDVRELKILATLLYPAGEYRKDTAMRWIAEIPYPEIAEQLSANLLPLSPDREEVVKACLQGKELGEFAPVCAFLTVAQLCTRQLGLAEETERLFLRQARQCLDQGVSVAQRAALLALKRYGRNDRTKADRVLELVAAYDGCGKAEQEEFYQDLKFEFEYYF